MQITETISFYQQIIALSQESYQPVESLVIPTQQELSYQQLIDSAQKLVEQKNLKKLTELLQPQAHGTTRMIDIYYQMFGPLLRLKGFKHFLMSPAVRQIKKLWFDGQGSQQNIYAFLNDGSYFFHHLMSVGSLPKQILENPDLMKLEPTRNGVIKVSFEQNPFTPDAKYLSNDQWEREKYAQEIVDRLIRHAAYHPNKTILLFMPGEGPAQLAGEIINQVEKNNPELLAKLKIIIRDPSLNQINLGQKIAQKQYLIWQQGSAADSAKQIWDDLAAYNLNPLNAVFVGAASAYVIGAFPEKILKAAAQTAADLVKTSQGFYTALDFCLPFDENQQPLSAYLKQKNIPPWQKILRQNYQAQYLNLLKEGLRRVFINWGHNLNNFEQFMNYFSQITGLEATKNTFWQHIFDFLLKPLGRHRLILGYTTRTITFDLKENQA